ncbi:hypothetical protein B0J13DRAFT_444010 [Dactylonectria estremocensis]|uniref:SH3 domain-containing protein n=1 Tax=Dactylonectria estremocensis TaxID=1079267 RepID=A0A9P9J6I0_9HYPO|nr:hypothetical protein B0J13DRAFT_444010 [Dactylonectria estremocensis]
MTRPTIIRADHKFPSAQDHTKSPRSATFASSNSLAPHQAETIREVSNDTADEQSRSPRISWDHGDTGDIHRFAEELVAGPNQPEQRDSDDNKRMTQEDALAVAQNGGISSSDEGDLDGDADDLDDDMMDKISSSPSIEDGGCCPTVTPVAWPRRVSSLSAFKNTTSDTTRSSGQKPPSPYPDAPRHQPSHITYAQLPRPLPVPPKHHLRREYLECSAAKRKADPEHDLDPYKQHNSDRWIGNNTVRKKKEDDKPTAGEFKAIKRKESVIGNRGRGNSYGCSQTLNSLDSIEEETTEEDGFDIPAVDHHDMPLMFPYEGSFEDDDDSDLSFPDDTRFIDSGWAAKCLQDTEDIDFEFVYALHTFVATVEGQANATKGDTMVLLDDSNSYWWLVRVVKDSSIGYLPAEHIETPTERLARLNKHRNVDLSATMLGDQQEKKPQTFKAIRLKRKTVAFAPPTYVDYSDFDDYSTDEEDLDELFSGHSSATQQKQEQKDSQQQQQNAQATAEGDNSPVDSAKVEPLKPRVNRDIKLVEPTKVETVMEEDETRNSEEILLDTKPEGPSRSRNGTVRNTDSFFKDDTVETKKITLTPNLLRDDNQPRPSTDSVTKDVKARGSMDKMDKDLMSDKEKKKIKEKERKEKEKKPSAIRSFFSRKDKKKSIDDDDESFGKRSMDIQSESAGRSSESPSLEEQGPADKIQRSPSKLQKQLPRTEPSPTRKGPGSLTEPSPTMELAAYLNESRTNDVSNVPPATMRIVDSETNETQEVPSHQANSSRERSASAAAQREDKSTANKSLNRSASTGADSRAQKTNRSRPRADLDDFSSDEDLDFGTQATPEPSEEEKTKEVGQRAQVPGAFPNSADAPTNPSALTITNSKGLQHNRLSESPVQVSPINATQPPALEIDTSSQEGRSSEEVPSPELLHGDETPKDSSSTRSGKERSWDDDKLRAFFDESDHVRDLLVVVYDKTNVEPESKEHPVVSGLFREQNAKLAEITTQLDNMLGDWLARKQRLRGTV